MARISPIPTSPQRARKTQSLEIGRLKLARLPPCSAPPIAPLTSISLIPSARLKLACFPTRSPPPRGFTFYLADPISSIAQISADSDFLNQEKRKSRNGGGGSCFPAFLIKLSVSSASIHVW